MLSRLLDIGSPHANRRRPLPIHKKLRWRGRRWYDPNWWKMFASSVGVTLLGVGLRYLVLGLGTTYAEPLNATSLLPTQGIAGSPHDLSRFGPNHVTGAGDACVFCHAPHGNPSGSAQLIPAWNHATTAVVFTMYTSSSLRGNMGAEPSGPSLACLSCHDGTVAMGTLHEAPPGGGETDYSNAQGGIDRTTGKMVGADVVGSNLAGVHPVSVSYQDDLVKSLKPAHDLVGVRLYPSNKRGAKVECGSCHDPHNFGMTGTTAPFLRVTKTGSGLCFACHTM